MVEGSQKDKPNTSLVRINIRSRSDSNSSERVGGRNINTDCSISCDWSRWSNDMWNDRWYLENGEWKRESRQMDTRYHKRINAGFRSPNSCIVSSDSLRFAVRTPRRIQTSSRTRKSFFPKLNYSFALIPFVSVIADIFKKKNGVVTEIIQHPDALQRAQDGFTNQAINHVFSVKERIAQLAGELHQRALLTPDPNDDKIDFIKYIHDYIGAAPLTHFLPDSLKEFIALAMMTLTTSTHGIIHGIYGAIYKFVTAIVLWTPDWIFEGDWLPPTVAIYLILSLLLVVVMWMIEGIKKIFNLNYTPFMDTLKKLPIMLGLSALTPIIFAEGTKLLNKITKLILSLGTIDAGINPLSQISLIFEPINLIFMALFLLLTIVLCIPITLFNARRWFDFLMLAVVTPFSLAAWLFNSTEHYFQMWLRGIRNVAFVQLVMAFFISALGIVMFATPNPTTFIGISSKCLILLGGTYRLAFPPRFLTQGDSYESLGQWYRNSKNYVIDSRNKVMRTAQITDKSLVGGARIAGKLWRGEKLFSIKDLKRFIGGGKKK